MTGAIAALAILATAFRGPLGADEIEIFDTEKGGPPFLSPVEARDTINVPEGFRVTLFAGEPDVRQPIAMALDARGRLWVAENYTYAESSVNFEMRLYDRILIFADEDGDGRFDSRKVFWDRAQKLASVEVGFGGVWALCAPHLLFLPDRDGDDVPDGEPRVVLDGWDDGPVRHNIANGLRWGPDGWLYGRHGILATSRVGRPGTPASSRTEINCGIWRYHPVRKEFEVVANGTTNSWGHDWNDHGQLFFINTVIGHLWHVVPGAHYERMYGEDFNPRLYELMPQTADHFHWDRREKWSDIRSIGVSDTTSAAGGGHAHSGLMIYLGDDWPEEYRDDVFAINYHGRRLNRDRLERRGAGYVGTHEPDLVSVGDVWFRGLDLMYGPDGGVFISDWSDVGECHDSDGVHRSSGRIYKVNHGAPEPPRVGELPRSSNDALVRLQLHRNDWFVRQARLILHERAAAGDDMSGTHAALLEVFRDEPDVRRKLRALWCLHVTGGAPREWLLAQLAHPEEHVRTWAVKLLVDVRDPGPEVARALAALARKERSGLVRLFLASALQRLPDPQRWAIARGLAADDTFVADPALTRMIWYGVEPAVLASPTAAVDLAGRSRLPKLRRFIARRLTAEIDDHGKGVDLVVRLAAEHEDRAFRFDVLTGMKEALRGRKRVPTPASWPAASPVLVSSADPRARQLAREIAVIFGDASVIAELRRLIADDAAPTEARQRAIATLVQSRAPDLNPLLAPLLRQPELAQEAIRGLGALGDPDTPRIVLEAYPGLEPVARTEAARALSSRASFAAALLDAVAAGDIPRSEIPTFQVRRMKSLDDESIRGRLDELWPELSKLPEKKRQQMEEFRKKLDPETIRAADALAGREVFKQTCETCHKMFAEGGDVGPELTGTDRGNLAYLLENILDPSAQVASDYQVSVVILDDGQVLNGVVTPASTRTLQVQTPTEKLIVERASVLEIEKSASSLMPEGILESLPEGEVRDLFAYLMTAGRSRD